MAVGADEAQMTEDKPTVAPPEGGATVHELLELARNKSSEGRKALFLTISDLFLNSRKILSDREQALMGEILRHLVHEVEMPVRRSLSERLAKLGDAPHELIVALANDEIEVAHPILIASDVLQDMDLIEIIHQRTMQHQLAVTMRKSVSEEVAKALVETGNEDVVASVLENHGAAISREVMEYLVSESKRLDRYQNPLVRRPDLPTDLAQRMFWWVSAALRKHIVEQSSIDVSTLDDEIEAATVDAIAEEVTPREESAETEALISRLADLGELTPEFLLKALRQGEVPLFEAGLARLAGLRRQLLRRIIYEPGGEGLVILCKALGIERSIVISLFRLTRYAIDRAKEPEAERLEDLLGFFDRTKQSAALKVLRRWQRNSEYLYALKRLCPDD